MQIIKNVAGFITKWLMVLVGLIVSTVLGLTKMLVIMAVAMIGYNWINGRFVKNTDVEYEMKLIEAEERVEE